MKFLAILCILFLVGCFTSKQQQTHIPQINSSQETKRFKDSLSRIGVDSVLIYYKSHGMLGKEYFVFWMEKEEFKLRKINSKGIFRLATNDFNGFYRNNKIFEFFDNNRKQILSDSLSDPAFFHYPSSNIEILLNGSINTFHLPDATQNVADNSLIHFARLIESVLFNLIYNTYWIPSEKSNQVKQ